MINVIRKLRNHKTCAVSFEELLSIYISDTQERGIWKFKATGSCLATQDVKVSHTECQSKLLRNHDYMHRSDVLIP